MADQHASSSSRSSSNPWHQLQKDFEEVHDLLLSYHDAPTKAWQPLSRALSKHSTVACYSEPWKWAPPSKLSWTLCHCITLLLRNYKYHQDSRRQSLCQLCQLTAQLFVQCSQQEDTGVNVSLAKQVMDSELLQELYNSFDRICNDVVKAVEYVDSVAAAGQAAATSRAKNSFSTKDAFDALPANLQLVHDFMQLFCTINSIWPGQAGILSSHAGANVARAVDLAAGQILLLITTAAEQRMVPPELAERYVRTAVQLMSLRAQQMSVRLSSTARPSSDEGQQGGDTAMLLGRVMLLWCLRLESISTAAGMACRGGCKVSSHSNSLYNSGSAADPAPCKPLSCSNSSSSKVASALSVAAGTPAVSSSAMAEAATTCRTPCARCRFRVVLLSCARPEIGGRAMSDHLWQVAVKTAADSQMSHEKLLKLLEVLLDQLRLRSTGDLGCDGSPTDAVDSPSCKMLAPLIVTLLDTASRWYSCDQQPQMAAAAAAAIGAASAAADAWGFSSFRRSRLYVKAHPNAERQDAFQQYEKDSIPEIIALGTQLLPQVLQLLTSQPGIEPSSPGSSSNSSASSSGCLQDSVPALLFAVAHTMNTADVLVTSQPGDLPAWCSELQHAVACIETCVRTVAPTADKHFLQRLLEAVTSLLSARSIHFGPCQGTSSRSPETQGSKPNTSSPPPAAGAAATACNISTADVSEFALLVTSLKLAALLPGGGLSLAAAAGRLASAMMKPDSNSNQPTAGPCLAAAMPWLRVRAGDVIAAGRWVAAQVSNPWQPATAAGPRSSKAAAEAGVTLVDLYFSMNGRVGYLRQLCTDLKLLATVQPDNRASPAPPAAAAATAAVQPELMQLIQQWEQQLLPQVQQAALLFTYMDEVTYDTPSSERALRTLAELNQLSAAASDVAKQAAAVAGPDQDQVERDRLAIIFRSPVMQQLPQLLEAAGNHLCALLPLPLCCNNPGCGNMSKQSELQLVGGKACVCAGCEVARYCGRECQAAHWQAHKRVCKMIRKSRAEATISNTNQQPSTKRCSC